MSDSEEELVVDEIMVDEPMLEERDFDATMLKDYAKMKQSYQTTPVLTKYEKTRVLAERASQIANGSPVFIPNPENYANVYDIALKELSLKKYDELKIKEARKSRKSELGQNVIFDELDHETKN